MEPSKMSMRFTFFLLGLVISAFCWALVLHQAIDSYLIGSIQRSATTSASTINASADVAVSLSSVSDLYLRNTTPQSQLVIQYRQNQMHSFLFEALHQGNMLCRDLAERQNRKRDALPVTPVVPIQYKLELNCAKMFYQHWMGTGNVVEVFYGLRLAARVLGNTEVRIQCSDAEATKSDLLLPWVTGAFSSKTPTTEHMPPLNETCLSFLYAPVHYLMDDIRYEMRRMAVALVGIPYPTHPATNFRLDPDREKELQVPIPTTSLMPNIELDDVAIHFRCGDIIEVKPNKGYGYTRFSTLVKYISSEARTIGIVTQPFQGQNRRVDGTKPTRCPILIGAFQQYLQERFPNTTVHVRNSPNETVALSYARFIMANQSLAAGYSTFVFFPFMATFGTGYLQKPRYVEQAFEQHVNARFIEYEDLMTSVELFELWKATNGQDHILDWFTSEAL